MHMHASTLRLVGQAAIGVIVLSVGAVWAADPPPSSSTPQAPPSKETREKMATLHEQMAACLRSDKSINDCRSEMMKSCRETIGTQGCQMMGKGHGWMMQTPPTNTTSAK